MCLPRSPSLEDVTLALLVCTWFLALERTKKTDHPNTYAALMYVLVPMPWLFFGQADPSSQVYGGSSLASG